MQDIIIAVDDMDKSTPKQDPHRVLDLPTASWAGVLSPLSIESLSTASEEKRGEDIDSFGEKTRERGIVWTLSSTDGHKISIPVDCSVVWRPRSKRADMAIVCLAPSEAQTGSYAFLCNSKCVSRWSSVIQHRITPSIRLELHSAPGDMLPVAPLALPVPPHTVRDALTLMHDSFADDRWHVSEGSDAEEGQERHEGKTIGQYISTYTVCDHISHHGPVVAGECPRCCSARLRSLAWDLVAETWEETGALLAFEEHLAPLGSLLDEWGCVEPKLLLQKAMNRKMYSKCTSKPCKHKHFVIEPEPVVKSSGLEAVTDALRAAMDTARDARLRYHREALLNYAVQFQDQLCEKDRLNRTAVRDRIPEMNRAHRRCWYDMLVGEA